MACPILDEAFEKHVQDYLCSESYDFLKAASDFDALTNHCEGCLRSSVPTCFYLCV